MSWVPGAEGSGFGVEHLPHGVISRAGGPPRPAVRIGEHGVELAPLAEAGMLDEVADDRAALIDALEAPTLNPLLEMGPDAWSALRARLTDLLGDPDAGLAGTELAERALVPLDQVRALLPIEVRDYVDFYSSLEHASNVGSIIRPDGDPLFPNWRHLPVGYHGRAGSVVPSGTPIRRPQGQSPPEQPGGPPGFGPERLLDFELELGFITGPGLAPGEPVNPAEVAGHVFGFALVNDWSARSMQAWEYQPLGPFLSKSFATSLATWITPLEAIEPFRVQGPKQEPTPPDYLRSDEPWALNLELEVALIPAGAEDEQVISRTNSRLLYWSPAQQLAHATIHGAEVRAGDLYASGTISGSEPGTQGCLLELTRLGQEPLALDGGAERAFLEDGDEVILRGRGATGEGRPALALAEVRGRVEPAPATQ